MPSCFCPLYFTKVVHSFSANYDSTTMTTHDNEHELDIEIEVQAGEVGRFDIGTQIKIYTRNMAMQYEDIAVRSFGVQTGLFTEEAQTKTEIT